ncbi:hypothetical protein PoB_000662200 [Plakobranchus ocellatus]|uniref:Uncharacterized protein n=1 Tax=Plakobranchus ocellatus TaxID=259542 RepID=A0AAV3YB84_9GAST|nr:hypothetical protein PoB_000662200 [Plakobranchus ocellatus]
MILSDDTGRDFLKPYHVSNGYRRLDYLLSLVKRRKLNVLAMSVTTAQISLITNLPGTVQRGRKGGRDRKKWEYLRINNYGTAQYSVESIETGRVVEIHGLMSLSEAAAQCMTLLWEQKSQEVAVDSFTRE